MNAQHNDALYWYEGGVRPVTPETFVPFYISHIPKTGVTSLFQACHAALAVAISTGLMPFPEGMVLGRADDPNDILPGNYTITSSMMPFGFQNVLQTVQKFKLVTVLRHPYVRIMSHYTYECMRCEKKPTKAQFKAFFQKEENMNLAAKHLSGLSPEESLGRGMANMALSNLINEFSLYGSTKHIGAICESILKINGLPNVISEALNKTLDEYKLLDDPFFDEVMNVNAADMALFLEASERPRIALDMPPDAKVSKPAPITVIGIEVGDARASQSSFIPVRIENIAGFSEGNRFPRAVFNQIAASIKAAG